MGKVYFNAWSMDVKVEGENVVRHLDMTTHNHGSGPGTRHRGPTPTTRPHWWATDPAQESMKSTA